MIYGHIKKMKKEINQIGKEVIDLQIKSLRKLRNSINQSFESAVKSILKCKSKVIICGVGKSGIIASKISATLSSVGTPSFAVSASDCSHGDLGRITNKDILILISYSGNTLELKNIIKYAKFNKILLIGIVSDKNSILYKSSNIKLLIPQVVESGDGIVPTSSTTAQLAIGDAIAMSLLSLNNINTKDFAELHPGGQLGKSLTMTLGDLINNTQKPTVNHNDKIHHHNSYSSIDLTLVHTDQLR